MLALGGFARLQWSSQRFLKLRPTGWLYYMCMCECVYVRVFKYFIQAFSPCDDVLIVWLKDCIYPFVYVYGAMTLKWVLIHGKSLENVRSVRHTVNLTKMFLLFGYTRLSICFDFYWFSPFLHTQTHTHTCIYLSIYLSISMRSLSIYLSIHSNFVTVSARKNRIS